MECFSHFVVFINFPIVILKVIKVADIRKGIQMQTRAHLQHIILFNQLFPGDSG